MTTPKAFGENPPEPVERRPEPTPAPPIALESATILHLEPGDVFILKSPHAMPDKPRLLAALHECFPGNHHKMFIFENGLDLQVVRPAKAEEAT